MKITLDEKVVHDIIKKHLETAVNGGLNIKKLSAKTTVGFNDESFFEGYEADVEFCTNIDK